jgi:hypothetical protein
LWEKREQLEELGVAVLIVTFESGQLAAAYLQESAVSWPMAIDEQRHLYKSYRMDQASFWDLWGPLSFWAYLKQLLKGNLPQAPTGDVNQRGGNVLIDETGKIKLHHVGAGPADRPSIKSIIDVVLEIRSQKAPDGEYQ